LMVRTLERKTLRQGSRFQLFVAYVFVCFTNMLVTHLRWRRYRWNARRSKF
jgi:hypothetical protein